MKMLTNMDAKLFQVLSEEIQSLREKYCRAVSLNLPMKGEWWIRGKELDSLVDSLYNFDMLTLEEYNLLRFDDGTI